MHDRDDNILIELATHNDLRSLVALHNECFTPAEHLGKLFGKKFIEACYHWFLTSGQGYILVARNEKQIVGAICVSDSLYETSMMRACKKQMLYGFICRPWLVFHPSILKRIIWSFKSRTSQTFLQWVQGCAQAAFMMVSGDQRGKGLATRLQREAIQLSISRGASGFFSYIKATNIASRRTHEKLGFIEVHALASRGFVCMRKEF